MFFNIAVKELYAKFAEIIGDDDGLLFYSIADDCKIISSPETIAKLLVAAEAVFATAGLHLERSKSRVLVRPRQGRLGRGCAPPTRFSRT